MATDPVPHRNNGPRGEKLGRFPPRTVLSSGPKVPALRIPVPGTGPFHDGGQEPACGFCTGGWRTGLRGGGLIHVPSPFPLFDGMETTLISAVPDAIFMSVNSENLERAIVSAIRNGVEDQDIAVAFSGGLDSGLVAAIAKDYARSVTLYTSGKEQSYDVVMAQEMSERLGLPWLHIPITADNIESRLREMITITGTSSPLTLSFELPLFFVCRTVHEKLILGGQGSDELFAGYSKYVGMPDDELARAMKSDMGKLITSTIPHETKVADHFGKKILYPYMDPIVTMQVNAMDLKELKPADADSRKMLLKQVARNLGYPFIAEKRKKAAQYGSGTMDLVREVAKNKGMTYSELVDSIYREIFE